MRWRGLICIFAGHEWRASAAATSSAAVALRCSRCGSEQIRSSETYAPEPLAERVARAELADNPYWNPGDDPRLDPSKRR